VTSPSEIRNQESEVRNLSPPWRLAIFVLACAAGIMGMRLAHSLIAGWIPVWAREAGFMVVMVGGLLIGHAWTFSVVDRRGWKFVGLDREALRPASLAFGAGLGALAIAVPAAALLAIGWLQVQSSDAGSSLGAAMGSMAVLIPAAFWEELFVRGYAFQTIRERWGATGAIVATSLLFGGLHFLNEGSTLGAVSVVTLAGIFLGLVLVRTGSLYAAFAAHLAWNAVLVAVMHANVSGVAMDAPDYRIVDSGPDWATGGTWGPEGGIFAVVGLAIATWIIFRRPTRRLEPDA
jgi:membrane protease YdiL (CAAX protease family)